MKSFTLATYLALVLILSACASGHSVEQEISVAQALKQPARLLAAARKIQAEEGCENAIPTYRVVSSFGGGHDVAQYELGACLLEIENASPAQTKLLREESILWLRRAAWANDARAQLKLSQLLSGVDAWDGGGNNHAITAAWQEEALGWAILYGDHSARKLFELPPVPSHVIIHLEATLTPEAMKRAEFFAANFEAINMASFIPPRTVQTQANPQHRPQGRQGDQRRRRH